jgi:hypothetical protein
MALVRAGALLSAGAGDCCNLKGIECSIIDMRLEEWRTKE